MSKLNESLKDLEKFEIIIPAKNLLNSITVATKATDPRIKMNERRLKEMRLVLGYLNAYVKAFGTKTSYFKLIGISAKIKAFKGIKK